MTSPKEVSLPSIYDVIDNTVFWFTMLLVIVTGFGIHELVRCHWFPDDDDDPDGWT